MERETYIPFHKELLMEVEPILKSEGFILTKVETSPSESLIFERKANQSQDFGKIIFHRGGHSPLNQIYVQAQSGDIHLLHAEDLLPNFIPSTQFGGWSYNDEADLKAVVAKLVDLTKNYLLNWFKHPAPILKSLILDKEQLLKRREELIQSIEVREQLIARFKAEGNLEEQKKWEQSLESTRNEIASIDDQLNAKD
jgi:hypothetical protein